MANLLFQLGDIGENMEDVVDNEKEIVVKTVRLDCYSFIFLEKLYESVLQMDRIQRHYTQPIPTTKLIRKNCRLGVNTYRIYDLYICPPNII